MIKIKCVRCGEIIGIKAVKLEKRIDDLEAENKQLRASLDLYTKSNKKSDLPDVFTDIFKNFNM